MCASSYAKSTIIALAIGVAIFLVSCILRAPGNATLGFHILNTVVMAVVWFAVLGVVALIGGALARRVRALWLPIFAWLLLTAAMLQVGVSGYSRYVLLPRVRALLADIEETNRVEAPFSLTRLARPSFSLSYPSNWSIDTADAQYDPDSFFTIETPDDGMIQFLVFAPHIDTSPFATDIVSEFRDKQFSAVTSTSFSHWGRYEGKGIALRGKLLSILRAEVRVFHASSASRPFIVVEMCYDDSRDTDQVGFQMIRDTFVVSMPPGG